MALSFQVQKAAVDFKADLAQGVEVVQLAAEVEVVGVIEGGLGTEGAITLPVLLDPRAAMRDLQAGVDPLAEDAGPKTGSSATEHAMVEHDLELLGSAEVELVFDHLLEELAAVERAVEDLGATDLKLQDGKLVLIPRATVLGSEGVGEAAIDTLATIAWQKLSSRSYTVIFQLGGAIARVGENAMAFSGREAAHAVNINAAWVDGQDPNDDRGWARTFFEALQPYGTGGVYVNFLGNEGEDRVKAAYGQEKYKRLAALKAKWDPGNVFRMNQNIQPRS